MSQNNGLKSWFFKPHGEYKALLSKTFAKQKAKSQLAPVKASNDSIN